MQHYFSGICHHFCVTLYSWKLLVQCLAPHFAVECVELLMPKQQTSKIFDYFYACIAHAQ